MRYKSKKPREDIKHYIYKIEHNGMIVYWGITSNPEKRQYQHNQQYKNGYNKQLYNWFREIGKEDEIILKVIKEVPTKIEAMRYECLQILLCYFQGHILQQSIPRISTI